ncbi:MULTISPECIES: hypothetical protein [unclassified Ensifer]|uniref:hypothetical protein n=1 Tax=unclassified Ensifer TaxID=2633371 RepID=UPI0008135F80|nr:MULTISPECIES: hypothetical protein [unclassified Ensifer]OCP22013.1 hypothetical protein BC361_25955 [Ensifer sp. LC54]OCP23207.1 hypothetical protein BC363_24810 [Ensifer sp. LC384]
MSDDTEAEKKAVAKITVRNYVDTAELKKDLGYTLVDISGAQAEQAQLFAHYGVQAAKAARQVDNIKLLLENAEAAVYRVLRDKMVAAGEKVTEALLDKLVTRHERVTAVKKALNEAKQIEAIAKTAVEAFRHRKDMLVQHGATEREEMKGELVTKLRSSREEDLTNLKEGYLKRVAQNAA